MSSAHHPLSRPLPASRVIIASLWFSSHQACTIPSWLIIIIVIVIRIVPAFSFSSSIHMQLYHLVTSTSSASLMGISVTRTSFH
ncbi:hypothetical protein BJ912DRAFT_995381 [Pholiota molesta]|nr:hypothetical protein BJ912DRAFT_995381 [Pholiota molesta]